MFQIKKIGLLIGCVFTAQFLFSQFGFVRSEIPVSNSSVQLHSPWAGGLNCPQFSSIDLNFDHWMDLFVLDRSANQIRLFVAHNDSSGLYYKEAPEYRSIFPTDIRYRCTLLDYNLDNKPDIFTYGIGGIEVYKNIGDSTLGHQWVLKEKLIYSNQYGSPGNLYVSVTDIPSIVDVDGDTDLDILTYNIGGQRIEYHKNISMETYGIPDSLHYELMNECWGKFKKYGTDNDIMLNDTTSPCDTSNLSNPEKSDTKIDKHTGSSLLAIDMDHSSTMDLIVGDVHHSNLDLLMNGGAVPNANSPMVSLDTLFPSNSVPIDIDFFPAVFWVDTDFDSVKDIIAAPNAQINSIDRNCVWRYKNTGSDTLPNFVFQQTDFLQNDMIDVGSGSIPIIVDVNQDGLQDLLVSNYYRYKYPASKESTVSYYENTGALLSPKYTYISDNQFNLLNQGFGLRIVPTFGDLDNDGDIDMLVGDETGTIAYVENTAGMGNSFSFSPPQMNYADNLGSIIDIGSYSAPVLVDLSGDGLLDLVIGTKAGKLVYYKNTGTATNPSFQFVSNQLGNVYISPTSPNGYAIPHFVKANGNWNLFVGAYDGQIHYFTDIESNLNDGDSFTHISDTYLNISVNQYSSFATSDLDQDGNLELFVGEDLGGIELYEADPSSTLGVTTIQTGNLFNIYPNPAQSEITIETTLQNSALSIINNLGQVVYQENLGDGAAKHTTINVQDLPNGMYFLILRSNESQETKKILISR